MVRKKILWLCSWYPSVTEPFNGDFIQRHAQAAALYNDIQVIHVTGDSSGQVVQISKSLHTAAGLTEHIILYKKRNTAWGKLLAHYRWLFLFKQAIRKYMVEQQKPDLVHVHIPYKAAIPAMWFYAKYKVPYVLSEHWGIYNDVEVLNYNGRSRWFKKITKAAFTRAAACISVSRFLAAGVQQQVAPVDISIIPNVVDTRLFHRVDNPGTVFRFIHVSNMVPLKNTAGILRAFHLLLQKGERACLLMVGNPDEKMPALAASLGLTHEEVIFTGEIAYTAVAARMQESHCLLLNSNIENSPCVIGEALCCGLPVIATAVGGVPELIDEKNGLLIPAGDDQALVTAMQTMMERYPEYDRGAIAAGAARKFSYDTVGKAFDDVYEKVIGRV